MSLRDELKTFAPRLRRFARALAAGRPGENECADSLVRAALMKTLEIGGPRRLSDLNIHLYGLLIDLHHEAAQISNLSAASALENLGSQAGGGRAAEVPSSFSRDSLPGALAKLTTEEREALALVVIERFSYAQAARILKISRPLLISRLSRARATLGENLRGENLWGENLRGTTILHPSRPRPSHLRVVK
ncbi:sigma factor-like helix-turn-helix DNA-binding protein [Methylocapsa palsarum]|uniref:RNA polymerase sigma-70 factor, ECF subfamily n=1 Tax=Methylocapsa palsarum TaxID=1612308 RepID=A0A1I3ZR22_9HYPH|nr:sigma factor-like helix-turn-helix DNA-binding protein [Methylocapsa palsarum]SFK46453.1 RNA polymerase sigma-70 factor, ECF subfamily [Methylocapsa palsarum]